MHATHPSRPAPGALAAAPRPARRAAYAALAAALLALAVAQLLAQGTGLWQFLALGAAPDLALLLGAGRGLEPGQLHPRAVPLYNAAHRYWGPLALGAAVAAGLVPAGFLAGALAWALHVSLDRAVGYGLRTRDGHQRS